MIVIPAIDIYGNKVVRLKEGDFNEVTSYASTPLEQAMLYEQTGFKWLHMVDLAGSKTGEMTALDILKEIRSKTSLRIEFGGGVRDRESARRIIDSGADRVIIGSLSVRNKPAFESIIAELSPEKIIVAADVKDEMIAVSGWTEQTGVSLYEHIEYCTGAGVDTFLCTDISKDGLLTGTNTGLYEKILERYPSIKLIASGGIKDLDDVKKVGKLNVYGVVVGRAIYENKINIKELAEIG